MTLETGSNEKHKYRIGSDMKKEQAMKIEDRKKLRKAMEKGLNEKRYEHTLSVAYTAASLAMVHGENPDDAYLAGMLHDCAKGLSGEKMIEICRKNNIPVNEVELKNPTALLHAKVGSHLAQKKYDISEKNILHAIQYHTTGRPGMSTLEKIIYIADYIEPGRKHATNLEKIRKMAFINLDQTLLKILEDTLSYLRSAGGDIDSMTRETYDYYRNLREENK